MTDRELIRLLDVFMSRKRAKGKPRGKSTQMEEERIERKTNCVY
jgi:hypothetical protein